MLRELVSNSSDPDIDDPIDFSKYTSSAAGAGVGAGTGGPSPEQISMLCDMGFSPAQAKKALRETVRCLYSLPLSHSPDDRRSSLIGCRVATPNEPWTGCSVIRTTRATMTLPSRPQIPPHQNPVPRSEVRETRLRNTDSKLSFLTRVLLSIRDTMLRTSGWGMMWVGC